MCKPVSSVFFKSMACMNILANQNKVFITCVHEVLDKNILHVYIGVVKLVVYR